MIKNNKNPFPEMEHEVLNFWDKAKTFEKSVERDAPQGDYVFYDGPPFGTGEPHYGHLLSSIAKDVVPRYWTMKGYRVERRWGWDCHGLPIENIIEKDLGISGKKEIERIGIAKFNEACRARVLEYAEAWDKMIHRIARWVEFRGSYKTMDLSYMESIWWAFKELWNKGLVYQGRKVLLYCPRCETPISNFEVAMDNSYQEITEASVYVKFKVRSQKSEVRSGGKNINISENIYILAWTTTPWTLPGNVALAVGKDLEYVKIKYDGPEQIKSEFRKSEKLVKESNILPGKYILAKDILWKNLNSNAGLAQELKLLVGCYSNEEMHKDLLNNIKPEEFFKKYKIEVIKGKELVGLDYEPLFDVPALRESGKRVHYVVDADFVTVEDGTGVVHTAVVYGEDDYSLGLKLDLPVIPALDEKGYFNETVPQFKGRYFLDANKDIIEDLDKRGLLFKKEDYTHSYPFCYRCETQLFYNAIPAWFINIEKLRKRMLEVNENIYWFPEYLKYGRFAQGIEQAPDWNISRNRYFATPMPIWECDNCGKKEIIGSVDELKEKSINKNISDIHRHFIDDLTWDCSECAGKMRRIKEVFDCWVESGSMSFAQHHYPFENKEKFENTFPAQYISEYISQTRAWFYVMHVMSTALFDSNSFENVATTGVILNEHGEKMSKSKKNFPDPNKVIDEFGADALRFYLMSSSVMHSENINFNELDLRDVFRKNVILLWNVYKFYFMYADQISDFRFQISDIKINNILDKWIMARLNQLIGEVTGYMDKYDMPRASRPITDFINDFSTWYLRRSRERFKSGEEKDRQAALETTGYVLLELSKLIAPFMPFIAEQLWQKVNGYDFKDENKSVHLKKWPTVDGSKQTAGGGILEKMEETRKIVELGLAARDEAGIRVRQPLKKLEVRSKKLEDNYIELIKEEVNVKAVEFLKSEGELKVLLDTEITSELKREGIKREMVRFINSLRKDAGLTIKDNVHIFWETDDKEIKEAVLKHASEIKKDTLASDMGEGKNETTDINKEVKINEIQVWIGIKKLSA